jgi:hypothetical protein
LFERKNISILVNTNVLLIFLFYIYNFFFFLPLFIFCQKHKMFTFVFFPMEASSNIMCLDLWKCYATTISTFLKIVCSDVLSHSIDVKKYFDTNIGWCLTFVGVCIMSENYNTLYVLSPYCN